MLEGVLPELPAPSLLRDFITGRASRRCHDVVDRDHERLVWGVDRGMVRFVAVIPESIGVDVTVWEFHHHVAGTRPFPIARVTDNLFFERRAPPSLPPEVYVRSTSATLPSFDALLKATARVRAGASVREALAGFGLPLPPTPR